MSSHSTSDQSAAGDVDYNPVADEEVDDLANNAFIESLLDEHMGAEEAEEDEEGEACFPVESFRAKIFVQMMRMMTKQDSTYSLKSRKKSKAADKLQPISPNSVSHTSTTLSRTCCSYWDSQSSAEDDLCSYSKIRMSGDSYALRPRMVLTRTRMTMMMGGSLRGGDGADAPDQTQIDSRRYLLIGGQS